MIDKQIRQDAVKLRMLGKSYSEIRGILGVDIKKSTMATWFRGISLSYEVVEKFKADNLANLKIAQEISVRKISMRRKEHFDDVYHSNLHLSDHIKNVDVSKIALAMLYLAEGSKRSGSITFANSDPSVISLFLQLLNTCYKLCLEKFRCTVQCRADQDISSLELYWSGVTGIPLNQFSKAQVDPRTTGKPTRKVNYKGVCRINYFSAEIFNELSMIPRIIFLGH